MQTKFLSKKKRGIGELLAALIVIGITIIAGIVVYDVLFARMNTIGYTAGISIQDSTIANGMAFITIRAASNSPIPLFFLDKNFVCMF